MAATKTETLRHKARREHRFFQWIRRHEVELNRQDARTDVRAFNFLASWRFDFLGR
jgi:hypothetical protein